MIRLLILKDDDMVYFDIAEWAHTTHSLYQFYRTAAIPTFSLCSRIQCVSYKLEQDQHLQLLKKYNCHFTYMSRHFQIIENHQ